MVLFHGMNLFVIGINPNCFTDLGHGPQILVFLYLNHSNLPVVSFLPVVVVADPRVSAAPAAALSCCAVAAPVAASAVLADAVADNYLHHLEL